MRNLKYILNNFMTSRHVTSRHVTSFILNFIQNYVYIIYLSFVKYSYSFLISIQTAKSLGLKPAFSERILFALQILIVKMFLNYSEFLFDKIVYIFEIFIYFSKIYYEKPIFLVFLIHEYHCMILVVCYNINKKIKNAIDKAKE